jgi:flagellar FliL protein
MFKYLLIAASFAVLSFSSPAMAGGKSADHGDPAAVAGPIFVELDRLTVPIINQNGVSQTVSMLITVEAQDQATADKITSMKPRLKDAFIQDMYGALSRQAALQGGVIKVDVIKARLNKVTQKVMGPDIVSDVLLQAVLQRRV